jgi:hypothetical protein
LGQWPDAGADSVTSDKEKGKSMAGAQALQCLTGHHFPFLVQVTEVFTSMVHKMPDEAYG